MVIVFVFGKYDCACHFAGDYTRTVGRIIIVSAVLFDLTFSISLITMSAYYYTAPGSCCGGAIIGRRYGKSRTILFHGHSLYPIYKTVLSTF